MTIPSSFPLCLAAIVFLLPHPRGLAAESELIPLPAEWRQEAGTPAESGEPHRPALLVKVKGRDEPYVVPMAMDTALLNKDARPQNAASDLQVRDNRFHQALFQPDLSALPRDAAVESASFRFRIGWRERAGGARLAFHQMLTPWSPEASWIRPSAEGPDWNGMKAGGDYVAEPFAVEELASVEPGIVTVEGFGPLVQDGLKGGANQGFVLQLFGAARQINVSSSESKPKKTPLKSLLLGGEKEGRVVLALDPAVLRRMILEPADIRGARVVLQAGKNPVPDLTGLTVAGAPGVKAENRNGEITFSGWGPELREAVASGRPSVEFVLSLAFGELKVAGPDASKDARPKFAVELRDYPSESLFEHPVKIQPGVYATVKDGHLFYGDRRLRIWGALGYGNVGRMRRMGFNGWRLWPTLGKAYSEESIRTGAFAPAAKGDGSELDKLDQSFAEFKSHGFFLMATQLMGLPSVPLLLRDDSFVAGGADWESWKEAVRAMAKGQDAAGPAAVRRMAFVDDRLRRARFQHAKNFLNHVNPYTGRRYAEEEAVAIWELDNELRFVPHVLEGGVEQWHPYFQEKFTAKWNAWLQDKYPSEAALQKAWGRLENGEKLGAILPAPTARQAPDFPKARAADFVRFVIELTDGFYQDLRETCRAQAPKNVGVAVAPFSFDTQYKPGIPWLYQQTRGDVANFGMYFWGLGSALTTPPGAYVMDSHTVEGKPTVIYETNQGRPSPYRAEFPYKLAVLASWQDWDAIFFHYWGAWDMDTDEEFLGQSLKHVDVSHFWNGVHHHNDPVMTAAMAVAGRIFLHEAISPARDPALYRVGAEGIFSYAHANGVSAGRDTFARGSRIRFEPDQDFDLIVENGGQDAPVTGTVQAGDQITWDWPAGRLIVDAPAARVFVGPVSGEPWKFQDGTTLSGLSSPWVAFGLTSADRKPLTQTDRIFTSAVFGAENTGFAMDWNVSGGPVDQAKAIKNAGRAPMIVDQVDFTLSFPQRLVWKFHGYDFALRRIVEGGADSAVVRVRNEANHLPGSVSNLQDREIWMGDLKIISRGENTLPIADANPGAAKAPTAAGSISPDSTNPKLAGIWNPLPGVSWGDGYARTHRILRDAPVRFGSITPESRQQTGSEVIVWSEARVLLNLPANFEITFAGGGMKKISATFVQPPNFRDAVAAYEKSFGMPAEKKLTDNPFEQSSVRWRVEKGARPLEVLLTEAQGVVKMTWTLL